MDAPGLIPSLIGAPLSPRGGGVAGTVEDLLVDPASHLPVWLLVRLRHSAQPYTFVPAARMTSRALTIDRGEIEEARWFRTSDPPRLLGFDAQVVLTRLLSDRG